MDSSRSVAHRFYVRCPRSFSTSPHEGRVSPFPIHFNISFMRRRRAGRDDSCVTRPTGPREWTFSAIKRRKKRDHWPVAFVQTFVETWVQLPRTRRPGLSLSFSPLQASLPLYLSRKLYLAAGRFTTFGGAINRATRTDLYIDIGALKYTNVPLIGLSPPVRTIKAALHSPPKSLLTAAPFKLEIWPLKVATIHRAYRTHRPPREKLFLQTGVRNDSPVFAVDLAEAVSDTGVERAIKSLNVFIGPSLVNADPGKNSWTRSQ